FFASAATYSDRLSRSSPRTYSRISKASRRSDLLTVLSWLPVFPNHFKAISCGPIVASFDAKLSMREWSVRLLNRPCLALVLLGTPKWFINDSRATRIRTAQAAGFDQ